MDFHKLVSKLKEIEPTNVFNPQGKATEAKPVQRVALSEDAQMRVLAGVSSILEEGRRISDRQPVVEKKLTAPEKKKKEEVVKSMKKDKEGFEKRYGDKGKSVMYATATKIAKKKAESTEVDVDALIEDEESSEFKQKFNAMVEAKKKEDKKTMAKKKDEKMEEAAKPDFLDLDKDGNKKEPMKSAAKSKGGDKKATGKKGMSAAQEKYFGKKNESADTKLPNTAMAAFKKSKGSVPFEKGVPADKKRQVKESIERKLSFVECLKIVKESGGQQQIDPVDSALWNWAQRVASNKVGSGIRADAYAARVYESYGGEFQLYDVLSENQK